MTLIETLAGLVILGTLLASLVVARSRYLHQWTLAGRRQQAIAAADALMTDWWPMPTQFPRQGAGQIADKNLKWKMHVINDPDAQKLEVQVVRLEVFEQRPATTNQQDVADTASVPLIYVDVVLPDPSKVRP
jgi:hypothetical protein